jgi:hypothetical protein
MFDAMKARIILLLTVLLFCGSLAAQESKPVPKNSVRVSIPGCTKGYIFTAGRRTADEPGSVDIPLGTHFRMNGPKKLIAEIKAQEGSMVALTGIIKRSQYNPNGVDVGGGARVTPGPDPSAGGRPGSPVANQMYIDVEGWRPIEGRCPN